VTIDRESVRVRFFDFETFKKARENGRDSWHFSRIERERLDFVSSDGS